MRRGMFGSLVENDAYKQAEKDWFVQLSQSDMYWYNLIVNPQEPFDTRKLITGYLKWLKKEVEENLDKRFVYFICSRVKIRFNTNKKPSYSLFTGKLKLHILLGKANKEIVVKTPIIDPHTNKRLKPKVDLTDKFITLTNKHGHKITMSIHDFFLEAQINIGQATKIQYVGYTKNPDTRPTDGAHAGLNEVLYKVSNEENDILIFFNLFKVMTNAINNMAPVNFVVSNAMTDEVEVDLEGKIIEKCFILYFDSNNQTKNKETERSQLKNNLLKLSKENKIKTVQVYYELHKPSEYWEFFSSSVRPSARHIFTATIEDGKIKITNGSRLFSEVLEPWV